MDILKHKKLLYPGNRKDKVTEKKKMAHVLELQVWLEQRETGRD